MSTELLYHALNSSPSKQQFTFGASKRNILNLKKKSGEYVSLPSALSTRGIKFSKSSRIMTQDPTKDNPPLGTYRSSTMGSSRSTCFEKVPIRETTIKKTSSPGPGSYDVTYSPRSKQFSMLGRRRAKPVDTSPGPADNSVPDSFNRLGRYVNSQISSKVVRTLQFTGSRFENCMTDTPGPGTYNEISCFSRTGEFFSPYLSSQAKRFSTAHRKSFVSNREIPGPGSYSNFSVFGESPVKHGKSSKKQSGQKTMLKRSVSSGGSNQKRHYY
jgi:hypothetical protein